MACVCHLWHTASMWHVAGRGTDRPHSGRQGKKQITKQHIKQGKGIRMALWEGVG